MKAKTIDQHIADWISGNEAAFTVAFDHYYPRLLATAVKLVDREEDAEELVMNVLLKVWQRKDRLDGIHDLKKYLYAILRQEVAGLARKKVLLTQDLAGVPLQNLGTVDHPEFALHDLRFHYQAALARLTPKQREVFLLSREGELSQQEIATHTGLSVHTVNNHISASLKAIRHELRDYPDVVIYLLVSGAASTAFLVN